MIVLACFASTVENLTGFTGVQTLNQMCSSRCVDFIHRHSLIVLANLVIRMVRALSCQHLFTFVLM